MKKMTNRVKLTNLAMNDDTYALRRKVISLIYEALHVTGGKNVLPRVEVRVTEDSGRILGKATLDSTAKHISIMASVINAGNEALLRHVVFHELVHTWFDARHNEKCPLMASVVTQPVDKELACILLKGYYTNFNRALPRK